MDYLSAYEMTGTAAKVGIIMGIAQIAKGMGLNAKYVPLLNIAVGILLSILLSNEDIRISIFNGIVAGLSASGLYSTQKNVKEGIKEDK